MSSGQKDTEEKIGKKSLKNGIKNAIFPSLTGLPVFFRNLPSGSKKIRTPYLHCIYRPRQEPASTMHDKASGIYRQNFLLTQIIRGRSK